ncbi:MAG: flagellar basal-body rod protein FlgG [Myxococcota bacterium]|jgi:flagellar basal-body rod protein FlgG
MRALYAAASGMSVQQTQLETVANNIANVGTTAFKRNDAAFEDLFYQELTNGGKAAGAPGMSVGAGARLSSLQKDHTQGSMSHTGNALHVAIQGDGYLEVTTPDGESLYTRDGRFTLDADGTLMTAAGLPVAGNVLIPPDAQSVEITADGTIRAVLPNDIQPTVLGQLEVVDFTNRGGLRAIGGNLYQQSPQSGEATIVEMSPSNSLVQGYLEDSNVDIASELVKMILTQRAYELNSKVVQAADDTMQVAVNLRR